MINCCQSPNKFTRKVVSKVKKQENDSPTVQEFETWLDNNPLKLARKALGHSQMRATTMMDVTINTVIRWEQGATVPSFENLRSLISYTQDDDLVEKWRRWLDEKPRAKE